MSEIDVSECEFLCKDVHCSCYVGYSECSEDYKPTLDLCKWHSDCNYRQLKRTEQKLWKIKDLCCNNIKKCARTCAGCTINCLEDKIITIINSI